MGSFLLKDPVWRPRRIESRQVARGTTLLALSSRTDLGRGEKPRLTRSGHEELKIRRSAARLNNFVELERPSSVFLRKLKVTGDTAKVYAALVGRLDLKFPGCMKSPTEVLDRTVDMEMLNLFF